jgi:hypothetical protein
MICREWLSRLYDALFPPFFSLGSPAGWDQHLLPETAKAIEIVREWLRELVYSIDPWTQRTKFLTFFLQANTLSRLFDKASFQDHINRARCMTTIRPHAFIRSAQGHYILSDCVDFTIGKSHIAVARGLMFAMYAISHLFPQVTNILST